MGVTFEITQRKHMEQQLEEQLQEIEPSAGIARTGKHLSAVRGRIAG